jgi:hypothetical protein
MSEKFRKGKTEPARVGEGKFFKRAAQQIYFPEVWNTDDLVEGDYVLDDHDQLVRWWTGSLWDYVLDPPSTTTVKEESRTQVTVYKHGDWNKPKVRLKVAETGQVFETNRTLVVDDMKKKLSWVPDPVDGVPFFVLPMNQLRWRESYSTPAVNMCGYNATDTFLEKWCGKRMDSDDRQWYERNGLVDKDGIGLSAIPTVVQQLVEPYNCRVSRIRLRPGQYVPLLQRDEWVTALGMNPMAYTDHATTNAEFCKAVGMPLVEANQLFRMDYHAEFLLPSILAVEGFGTSGGGHVQYMSPRDRRSANGWALAIQVELADKVAWNAPLVLPEPPTKEVSYELNWDEIRDEDGKKLYRSTGAVIHRPCGSGQYHIP